MLLQVSMAEVLPLILQERVLHDTSHKHDRILGSALDRKGKCASPKSRWNKTVLGKVDIREEHRGESVY